MDYYKKVGRPTDEEQAVINVIETLIKDKRIPRSEIPHCQTLDDLLEVQNLLEAYVSDVETEEEVEPFESNEEPPTEIESSEEETPEFTDKKEIEGSNDIDEDTTEVQTETNEIERTELDEDEIENVDTFELVEKEAVELEQDEPNFVADDYDPFSDEIKERSYTKTSNPVESITGNQDEEQEEPDLEESDETPIDNLNPNTKRKVAEQTANTLLKGYARLAPQPFKWLAKINEHKIEKLAFEGEININLEVSEGTTFDDYMRQTNEQVDEIFEVDEDTLDEIREPLIEVLLEQKMELTPQQRLMMAVVSHLFQMLTVAINLRRQNNRILEYQKRITLLAANEAA